MLTVFRHLWWKDVQWIRHHLPSTATFFLVPILAAAIFSYILRENNIGDLSKMHHKQQVMSIVEDIALEIYEDITVITYQSVDTAAVKNISLRCGSKCNRFTFEEGKNLNLVAKIAKRSGTKGIVLIKQWDVRSRNLEYEFIDLSWVLDRHLMPVWGLYSLDKMTKTFSAGDETLRILQILIDEEFLKQCREHQAHEDGTTIAAGSPDIVRYRADPLFNPSLQMIYSYMGLISAFVCLLPVWQGAQQIIEERKEGTKALLVQIGVTRFRYFASHFLSNSAKCLLALCIFWIPPIVVSKNSLEAQWILPVIVIVSLTYSSFMLLVATVFRDKWTSRLGSLFMAFVFHYGHMRTVDLSPSLSFAIPHSLFFPSSYYYYQSIAVERMTGFHSWDQMGAIYSLLTMLLNTVTMLLLMAYFENVSPGAGIQDKTADFIFRKKYWFKSVQPAMYETEDFRKISELPNIPQRLEEAYKTEERTETIHLDGVSQIEDDLWLINRVDLKMHLGEITVLYGPRGGGGRQILELLSTKKKADFGSVKFLHERSDISTGYIPDFSCLHRFTVEQTMKWVIGIRQANSEEAFSQLEELQMTETLKKPLSSLTTSERQSLCVLFSFIGSTNIVLLDEPTKNCTPLIRSIIHAFIINWSIKRTIVVSTYDPQEAEILSDVTVFMNDGHVICSGCTQRVKKKLLKCSTLVVWPSSSFQEEHCVKIQNLVSATVKQPVKYELMPNESIRYFIPFDVTVSISTLIGDLEKVQHRYGIKFCEASNPTLHEAYYKSCSRVVDTPTNYDEFVAPIKEKYEGSRTSPFWPEFKLVSLLRWKHFTRHFSLYLVALLLPLAILCGNAAFAIKHQKTADYLEFNPQFLSRGGVQDGVFVSNLPKNEFQYLPSNTKFQTKKGNFLEEDKTNWIYSNPPIMTGVFNHDSKYHILSLQPIRFSEIYITNILSNLRLNKLGKSGSISTKISSLDHQEYSSLLPPETHGTVWDQKHARRLCAIMANEYAVIFVVASLLTISLARSTLFPSRMAEDGCIRMHFMIGARPFLYWLTILLTDVFIFLLMLAIAIGLIVVCEDVKDPVILALCGCCCLAAFVSSLPFVYLMSLFSKNVSCAYFAILFLTGILSLMPGLLPMLAMEYGPRFESWLWSFLAFSCVNPPLAATLACTFVIGLHKQQVKNNEIIEMLTPLFVFCSAHIWTWLLVFILNSAKWLAFFTRIRFSMQHFVMRPSEFLSIENEQREQPAPVTEVTQIPTDVSKSKLQQPSSTDKDTLRAPAGMDDKSAKSVKDRDDILQNSLKQIKVRKMSSFAAQTKQFKVVTLHLRPTLTSSAMLPSPGSAESQDPGPRGGEAASVTKRMQTDQRQRISVNRSVLGLWDKRDQTGEQTPVVEWNNVPLAHYQLANQLIQMSIYESQALNLFGDLPETRSMVLDMAAGQSFANKGAVLVNGKPVGCGLNTGYVPRDMRLCTFLTGREILTLTARIKKYVNVEEIVKSVLQIVQLTEVADQTIISYSVSNSRMLSFATAIIDRPTILILDELDMYISPNRMKIVWSIVRLLRSALNVPVLFSTPRVYESETAASHTVMIFRGAVSIADTTLSIRKRFACLAILTCTLKKKMDKETTMKVICAQLDCQVFPHPRPEKVSFLLTIPDGKFAPTLEKIGALMHTIGIQEFQCETPDLDTIYSANFS